MELQYRFQDLDHVGRTILGVSLLHQCAPELVAVVRVAVNQLVVHRRQAVIDHNVHPIAKAPESKVENSSIGIRFLRVPFLLLPVGDDLVEEKEEEEEDEERKGRDEGGGKGNMSES